jgi:hypothetical protein
MKYILRTLNPITQEVINEVEYKSLRKMSQDLDTTYCSVYENYLHNEGIKPPAKKLSQVRFNKAYKIVSK